MTVKDLNLCIRAHFLGMQPWSIGVTVRQSSHVNLGYRHTSLSCSIYKAELILLSEMTQKQNQVLNCLVSVMKVLNV